jgi:hypothetical protein
LAGLKSVGTGTGTHKRHTPASKALALVSHIAVCSAAHTPGPHRFFQASVGAVKVLYGACLYLVELVQHTPLTSGTVWRPPVCMLISLHDLTFRENLGGCHTALVAATLAVQHTQ